MLFNTKKPLENNEKDIQSLLNALQKNPNNPLTYQELGMAFYKSTKFEEAKQYAEKAVELNQSLPLPFTTLSYIKLIEGDNYEDCYQLAQKAYNLAPEMTETIICLGTACLAVEKNEDGIKLLEKAVSDRPNERGIYNNLAIAYTRLNEFEKALNSYIKLYKLNPSFDLGVMTILTFFSQKKVKYILQVFLLGSFLGSIFLNTPILLIIPAIFASLIFLSSIVAFRRGNYKLSILTIFGSLLIGVLIFLILIW